MREAVQFLLQGLCSVRADLLASDAGFWYHSNSRFPHLGLHILDMSSQLPLIK